MPMKEESGSWDFTLVIELIYSLSATRDDTRVDQVPRQKLVESPSALPHNEPNNGVYQLGNFDSLWRFLGQPLNVPPPKVTPLLKSAQGDADNHEDIFSCKGVKWRDEIQGADLEDDDEIVPALNVMGAIHNNVLGLTKAQRKKGRRRQRRALEAKLGLQTNTVLTSSDNDESDKEYVMRQSDDRKAVIHELLHSSPLKQDEQHIGKDPFVSNPCLLQTTSVMAAVKNGWPVSDPFVTTYHALPIIRKTPEQQALEQAASRKATLMKLLYERFVDERQFLGNLNILQHALIGNGGVFDGIHVFVDASNIMIGFQDALKLSRGLSIFTRIRLQPFSFHNLSLILERGRPTAKRVLAGSDNFPAIQEAELIGYETNILDRVHKAKELTPRQKRFHNGNGISGQSSGSETNATHAPERWVEQAVDEILHLKILESVVDAEEPSTIVLATGDAAEAEYSGGFLRMVERALEKGWKVELVSFSRNTSGAYKKREFRMKWGESFKIIELDDFVEVLLGI